MTETTSRTPRSHIPPSSMIQTIPTPPTCIATSDNLNNPGLAAYGTDTKSDDTSPEDANESQISPHMSSLDTTKHRALEDTTSHHPRSQPPKTIPIPDLISRYESDSDDDTTADDNGFHNPTEIRSKIHQHPKPRRHPNDTPTEPHTRPRRHGRVVTTTHSDNQSPANTLIPAQVIVRTNCASQASVNDTHSTMRTDNLQDNHYIGNTLSLPKPATTTRIYFQNVNGISLMTPGTWDITCSHL